MTPHGHPGADLWLDYAAGQLDRPTCSLLEGHLAFCEACREQARAATAPGGAALAEGPEAPVPSQLLDGILARLKPPAPPRVGREVLPLPRALWPLLPALDGTAWRQALTRGFRFLEAAPGLYLIHMRRGCPFPAHGHRGLERCLILSGGLRDGHRLLEAGDFDETAPDEVHSPVALPDEDCWLLASLEGGIRFQGWRGVLQRLAGA